MTASHTSSPGWKRTQPNAGSTDGDRTVGVGAQHRRPHGPQAGERTRRGMPVPVFCTYGNNRQPRPDPLVQPRILVRGTVVGDLEDVHRTQLRMLPQEGLLRLGFEVAEQQQGEPRAAHQQDDARVVGPFEGRPGRRRPQHLPFERAGPAPLPLHRPHDRHPGGRRRPADELGLPGRLFQHGGLDHPHGPAPQDACQASHVVGVKVREQQHRHPVHPQLAQADVHRPGVRAGVHHHRLPGTDGEDRRVPLPHGALDVAPVGRRPAGERTGELRRPQYREEQQHRQRGAQPPPPPPAGADDDGRQDDGRQQQTAGEPTRPGQLRAGEPRPGPRDGGDPPRGNPGAPGEHLGGGHPERGRRQRGEAEDGRGTRRQLGQQIARHGHQADPGREHGDHGRAHRLGGSGGAHRLGEPGPRPAPPQGLAPPGSEGQQRPGGQDGEQEAVTAGQPRVVEHQQQYRGSQGGDQGPAPAGGDGQQGDRPAGRGPQHARLRPAHHHERQGQGRPAQGGRPQGEAEAGRQPAPLGLLRAARGPDEQEQHHGQVRPGDGQQVEQIGGPEGLVQVGRNPGRVPDDQSRQQGPRIRCEPLGGLAQPGPQPPRQPLGGVRAAGHPRRCVTGRAEQCHGPLHAPRRGQPGDHRHPRGGQQPGPSRVPGQHPHRGLDPGARPVGPGHPGDHRVQQHHRRPAAAPRGPGIGADGQLDVDPGVPARQCGDRPGPRLGQLEPRHARSGGRGQQSGRNGRGDPPQRPRAPCLQQHQQACGDHRQAHAEGGPPDGCAECEGGRRPGRHGGHRETQIHRARPLRAVHGRTSVRRSAKRRSPMPLTWRSSSTERKPPRAVRKSTMC